VWTQNEVVITDDEFEIKFSQQEEYNQFRNYFGSDAVAKIQKEHNDGKRALRNFDDFHSKFCLSYF